MRKSNFIFIGIFFATIYLTGCDPYYPILITNTSIDTALILVKTNPNFRTEKEKYYTTKDNFDVYKLVPKEAIEVGGAIAELDNDIPFEEIKILSKGDTIAANNQQSIKELFEKKSFGRLKKPYNILIK